MRRSELRFHIYGKAGGQVANRFRIAGPLDQKLNDQKNHWENQESIVAH